MRCSPLYRGLLAALLLLGGVTLASASGPDLDRIIPPVSAVPGWEVREGPLHYGPDDLFEYIDGAARMYLSFGFERLVHLRYAPAGDTGRAIVLDIYDMGSELGAYGIYTNGRPPDVGTRSWGAEGYRDGDIAVAWQGRVYIHASCEPGDQQTIGLLERIVGLAAESIPGEPALPEYLTMLPEEGLVPNSDRYVAKDLLGHAFLPGGMLARYDIGGELMTLFFCELESEQAARGAVAGLREYEELEGRILGDDVGIGDGGFSAEDPGLGLAIVVRSGRYAAGLFGGSSDQSAKRILARLLVRLN